MSNGALKLLAGSGAKGDPVYVDDVFSTFVYGGNGSSQTIDNGLDLSGEGGLVWTKSRENTSGGATSHALIDTVRGKTKWLASDIDAVEATNANLITAFNSNGYTVGSGGPYWTNDNGYKYVSWSFRKQPGFFDVVTYTGNDTARTISHNLGSTPGMIIVKNVDVAYNWTVYHRSMGGYNYYNHLNTTTSKFNNTAIWNAAPTSTVFSVGTSANTNHNGNTYIAYLFAHDAQDFGDNLDEAIIKCGSYTGNGSNTGPIIDLGFEPQWVMIRDTTSDGDWWMFDVMRGWGVVTASELKANSSAAEAAVIGAYAWLKPLVNGFQITDAATGLNTNGNNHIYMAIRRPQKPASEFAATKLFNVDSGQNAINNYSPGFDTGFPVDMGIFRIPSSSGDFDIMSRLTNLRRTDTPSAGTEANKGNDARMDYMDGWGYNAHSHIGWAWRRAPGHFDVVAYTGTGSSATSYSHNLGVVPEFIWIKRRDGSNYWECYHSALGATKHINLNSDLAARTSSTRFNDTAPTDSVFVVGNDSNVNVASSTYIAYLFASVDGVSKVGSYSGTGSNVDVDCGFSAGARFILIKRTDDAGDWYLYDSVQGIVAGNDPYLLLSSTAAQVTNTDYIDPLNAGFTVTSSAPAALNNSGSTYIFYAIA